MQFHAPTNGLLRRAHHKSTEIAPPAKSAGNLNHNIINYSDTQVVELKLCIFLWKQWQSQPQLSRACSEFVQTKSRFFHSSSVWSKIRHSEWSCFSEVDNTCFLCRTVVHQHYPTTSDTGRMHVYDSKAKHGSNRCINGRASFIEDILSNLWTLRCISSDCSFGVCCRWLIPNHEIPNKSWYHDADCYYRQNTGNDFNSETKE